MSLDHAADNATAAYALALKLGEVDRATAHPDGRRAETDTTHTVGLQLLCLVLAPTIERHIGIKLNLEMLLTFALVHDLVEAYAGDVNTVRPLSPEERAAKDQREADALERIAAELPDIANAIRWYEAQTHIEAQVVHYLDKACPKLTHMFNGGAALRRVGMDLAELREKQAAQGAKLRQAHPDLEWVGDLFDELAHRTEEAVGRSAAHVWVSRIVAGAFVLVCRRCGVVRQTSGNGPCRGQSRVTTRKRRGRASDEELLLAYDEEGLAPWELDLLFAQLPPGDAASFLRHHVETPDSEPLVVAHEWLEVMGRSQDRAVDSTVGEVRAAARRRVLGVLATSGDTQ